MLGQSKGFPITSVIPVLNKCLLLKKTFKKVFNPLTIISFLINGINGFQGWIELLYHQAALKDGNTVFKVSVLFESDHNGKSTPSGCLFLCYLLHISHRSVLQGYISLLISIDIIKISLNIIKSFRGLA